jgi:integrase
MSCKVKRAKGGRHLGLRLMWNGIRSWETTRLEETPENRDFLEAQAKIISHEMKLGTFDYLRHFPNGNKAHLFQREEPKPAAPEIVRSFYEKWIVGRVNQVRRQQVSNEKSHLKKHILPARIAGQEFGDMYLAALAIHHIQELQDSLKAKRIRTKTKDGKISEKPYKHASINNYMKALQAMLKDARRKGLITIDLFDRDLISKLPENDRETEIDPYLPDEREAILKGFREHRPHYHGFVFHQFWTGCRPSETCALRRKDIDLNYGWEQIQKSRVAGDESGTKSGPSNRQIRLHENLIEVLKDHVQFMLDPDAYLFTTPGGTPIDESNFYKREWLPMLRNLRIRPRDFYNTRHSYASFMLSIGARMNFISAQTGDSEETLRKHYAKYIESIDPQRDWIERQIRKSEKFSKKGEKSSFARSESESQKLKKPSISQGLKAGAGEEGRTPDLMLGKHTL